MAKDRPPRCQVILIAEAGLDPESLGRTLEAGPVAAVVLRANGLGEEALRAAIEALRPAAQEREVAFLLEGRVALALETGCDGLQLGGDAKTVKAARNAIGDDGIVGVYSGDSRHAAMLAAEAGADYVAFGGGGAEHWWAEPADPELLAWWQAIMTAPCVAMVGDDLDTAGAMAAAGADFVAVGAALWSHPDGPEAALRALLADLGEG